jgi:uncharacterized protein YjbI with pentapeptide repeats
MTLSSTLLLPSAFLYKQPLRGANLSGANLRGAKMPDGGMHNDYSNSANYFG